MEIGIIGLPNVGKSTVFNALTTAGVASENYPFCTIEPNVGIVSVPDDRLMVLSRMVHAHRRVPATIKFVDIAGLVRGACRGEGLGNQFLAYIREVDAVAHVVRVFHDPDVLHVEGSVAPLRDLDVINLELALADLEIVQRRLARVEKLLRTGEKKYREEVEVLRALREILDEGHPASLLLGGGVRAWSGDWSFEMVQGIINLLPLLTAKPVIYLANVSESDLLAPQDSQELSLLKEKARTEGRPIIELCAKIEAEVAELPEEERGEFLAGFGLAGPGLNRLIRKGYDLLGLITFFTAGEPEARAWTIPQGYTAPQAAGRIHSDIERGFIRAEVTSYGDLVKAGSQARARELGLVRLEGRDYVMRDGDVTFFRFNV